MFQVFTRNDSPSGKYFKLILVYENSGKVARAYEEAPSAPNIRHILLHKELLNELPSVHLSPTQYSSFRNEFKDILKDKH